MDISRDEIRAAVAAQLGSAVTEIADTDDLIQMGLNSMRMMSLAGGWRKRGSGITFADLAGSPTIERWHALLVGGEIASPATPDDRAAEPEQALEAAPFPLATMQHAYWIGRSDEQELGGVAAHLYVEFDGGPIDPTRLHSSGIATGRGPSDAANPIPAGWNATDDVRAEPARLQRGRPARTESGRGGNRTGGIART